jgi:hypothetical protein
MLRPTDALWDVLKIVIIRKYVQFLSLVFIDALLHAEELPQVLQLLSVRSKWPRRRIQFDGLDCVEVPECMAQEGSSTRHRVASRR